MNTDRSQPKPAGGAYFPPLLNGAAAAGTAFHQRVIICTERANLRVSRDQFTAYGAGLLIRRHNGYASYISICWNKDIIAKPNSIYYHTQDRQPLRISRQLLNFGYNTGRMSDQTNEKSILPAVLLLHFDGGSNVLALARALREAGMPVVAACGVQEAARKAQSAGLFSVCAPDSRQRCEAAIALLVGDGAQWPGYVLVDATGGYSAQDVLSVAEKMLELPDRLVLAERAQPRERGMLFRRERWLGSFLFRTLHGLQVTDPWCTLRGIPRAFVRELLSKYENPRRFWLGMLLTLRRRGIRTSCVPIGRPYRRERGATTLNRCADLLRIAEQTLRYVASSLTVLLVDNILCFLFFYVILHGNRPVSIAIGRFAGALLGYWLNRSVVFRPNNIGWRREIYTAGKYAALAGINYGLALPMNYLFFAFLNTGIVWSKLLADLVLYISTFFINREIVFRKRHRPAKPDTQQP